MLNCECKDLRLVSYFDKRPENIDNATSNCISFSQHYKFMKHDFVLIADVSLSQNLLKQPNVNILNKDLNSDLESFSGKN